MTVCDYTNILHWSCLAVQLTVPSAILRVSLSLHCQHLLLHVSLHGLSAWHVKSFFLFSTKVCYIILFSINMEPTTCFRTRGSCCLPILPDLVQTTFSVLCHIMSCCCLFACVGSFGDSEWDSCLLPSWVWLFSVHVYVFSHISLLYVHSWLYLFTIPDLMVWSNCLYMSFLYWDCSLCFFHLLSEVLFCWYWHCLKWYCSANTGVGFRFFTINITIWTVFVMHIL